MSPSKPVEHKGRIIRSEMKTRATAGQVWQAWADPEKLAQWFPDHASGEARTGGAMTWRWDQFGEFTYEVFEADPEKRLVLTGEIPGRPRFYLEILIQKAGGETLLRLVNSGFLEGAEWDEEYKGVEAGWDVMLNVLRLYLESYFGEPRRLVEVIRTARFEWEQVTPYFHEADFLSRWLTREGGIPGVGAPCRLVLSAGEELEGKVLAQNARQTLVSWNQIRGALNLSTFGSGPKPLPPGEKGLCLRATGWSLLPQVGDKLKKTLEAAADRLVAALA
jgi:uncharacterized protein YndB with AHSA1/START domain